MVARGRTRNHNRVAQVACPDRGGRPAHLPHRRRASIEGRPPPVRSSKLPVYLQGNRCPDYRTKPTYLRRLHNTWVYLHDPVMTSFIVNRWTSNRRPGKGCWTGQPVYFDVLPYSFFLLATASCQYFLHGTTACYASSGLSLGSMYS